MSTAVLNKPLQQSCVGEMALKASARFWFVIAVTGQLAFAFTIASYYGLTALRGDFQAWNRGLLTGYMAGHTMGNSALAGHILFATVISVAGALQLIPRLRSRFPAFHRWNGRVYLLAAFTQGLTGFYLTMSGRRIAGDFVPHVALWISAALLMILSALALRSAMTRDFKAHRRWALRLFLVASGSWFFRIGFFLTVAIFGPIGFNPATFSGPLVTFWSFAEYLLPLAILELYLRAQQSPGAGRRLVTATGIFLLTLAMGAGIVVVAMAAWVPKVKAAYDSRQSVAEILTATIAANGVDAAAKQYRQLKADALPIYNFDEDQLNSLGYELIHANQFKDAIRILQLNVEAYPQSANAYDSLGEAYMDDGDKPQAIANYRKSLQLNPKNHGAVLMIQKLTAP